MTKIKKIKLGLFITLLSCIVIFLLQNSLRLEVNFLFFNLLDLSLVKLLLIFFTSGILSGVYISYSITNWKKKKNENKDPLELEIE